MQAHLSTTPFGRRPLSYAMLAGQKAARDCPTQARVDKWKVFRAICEAKCALGATDRALAVLSALLTFHPTNELCGDGRLIVFPSNRQLSLRAHGMAPATLRRHLAVLVECGLVVRRDSPNGKRFARKGQEGAIEQAFGFDLTPIVARADEFEQIADEVRAERKALQRVRERLTLLRRDIAKIIAFGLEEGIAGDWMGLNARFRALVAQIPRTATRAEIEPVALAMAVLAEEARKILETQPLLTKSSANESQSEHHKHDSNPNYPLELEPCSEKEQGANAEPESQPMEQARRTEPPTGYPLGLVLRACPDIDDYAKDSITDWGGLVSTANLVRSALGVSPDAWNEACEVMGETDAAIVVAAILQRGAAISSAGGYLRSLTDKSRAGQFSLGPVLMALLRARTRGQQARAG